MGNLVVSMPGAGPRFYLGFVRVRQPWGSTFPPACSAVTNSSIATGPLHFSFFSGFTFETQGDALVGIRYRLQPMGRPTLMAAATRSISMDSTFMAWS